jgi:hypothetical protein
MKNTGGGFMDIGQALAMLDAFASVGVTAFDVTLTCLEGEPRRFMPNRSFYDLRRTIGQLIQDAERDQQNVILRPRCKSARGKAGGGQGSGVRSKAGGGVE